MPTRMNFLAKERIERNISLISPALIIRQLKYTVHENGYKAFNVCKQRFSPVFFNMKCSTKETLQSFFLPFSFLLHYDMYYPSLIIFRKRL